MATRSPQLELLVDEPGQVVGRRHNIHVGTCSWSDPSLIKCRRFYPRGCSSSQNRLRYYAGQFPLVEVDSSYFAMLDPAHAAQWAEWTPAGFHFNVKAHRLLTGHQTPEEAFPADLRPWLPPLTGRKRNWYYADLPQELRDEMWRRFVLGLRPLNAVGKLKAVHFQFAPWVTGAASWREHVEDCVRRMTGHLVAVEFRNRTWFGDGRADATLDWERGLGVVHVVVDEPQHTGNFAHGIWAVTNPSLAIVRLHGRNAETWRGKGITASSERFNYEYTDAEFDELAERMRNLAEDAIELQVLVNVNFEDQGVKAARRLHILLDKLNLPNSPSV